MIPKRWRLQKQRYSLVGSRCRSCSALHFPARQRCKCGGATEDYGFSGFGTVESFTVIRSAPQGFAAPYIVAVVKLDGGPSIVSQVVSQEAEVGIGKRVSAVFRNFSSDPESSGVIFYGFKFEVVETP